MGGSKTSQAKSNSLLGLVVKELKIAFAYACDEVRELPHILRSALHDRNIQERIAKDVQRQLSTTAPTLQRAGGALGNAAVSQLGDRAKQDFGPYADVMKGVFDQSATGAYINSHQKLLVLSVLGASGATAGTLWHFHTGDEANKVLKVFNPRIVGTLGKSLDLQVSNFEFEPVEHELAGQIQAHYHVTGLDLGAQLGVTYQKHFGMPNASVQVQWHFPDTGYRNPGKQPGTSRY